MYSLHKSHNRLNQTRHQLKLSSGFLQKFEEKKKIQTCKYNDHTHRGLPRGDVYVPRPMLGMEKVRIVQC